MSRSLDLIYSSHSGFFGNIREVREIVVKHRSDAVINYFNSDDEYELSRNSGTYKVFPELQKANEAVTLAALRNSLETRGVQDQFLQNKAISVLLQSKLGLPFDLGNMLNKIMLENGHTFIMSPDYNIQFKVKNKNHIELVFTGFSQDVSHYPLENDLAFCVKVAITPDRIALNSFKITQLSDKPNAKKAFDFLQANQASLWQKIVIFFKTYFNANADLLIENEAKSQEDELEHESAPVLN